MRKRIISYSLALALMAGLSIVSQAKAETATVAPGVTLGIGYAGEHFHYGETIGDQEHGWLNGIYAKLTYKGQDNVLGLGNLDLGLHFKYLGNSITYNGAYTDLATGEVVPQTATTNEGITQIEFRGGFDQALSNNIAIGEYAILGYRYWNRDMEGIGGYTEDYNNGYIGLGVKGGVAWTPQISTGLDLSFRWSPKWSSINYMSTDNFGDYDMGNAYNFRIGVPVDYNISPRFSINLEPYYSYWKFNKSDTHNVIYDGYSFTSWEPSSETNSLGINAGINYRF